MSEKEPDLIGLGAIPSDPRAARHREPRERVNLSRDCPAVLVPAGTPTVLPAGSQVTITQELGGDYSVMTSWGYMARIAGEHADALGREVAVPEAGSEAGPPFSEARAWDVLRKVYDPELPVNIVDLGLVYGVRAAPMPGGGHRVEVRMTLTAPGCGMGQVLQDDVRRKLQAIAGVDEVQVEIVFDPPWNRNMMSEAAQLELGLFG